MKEWGTDLLADPSFFRSMVVVRLPEGLIPQDGPEVKMVGGCPEYNFSHASYIGNILHHQYKVEVREYSGTSHIQLPLIQNALIIQPPI